jgi:hypothetical protein
MPAKTAFANAIAAEKERRAKPENEPEKFWTEVRLLDAYDRVRVRGQSFHAAAAALTVLYDTPITPGSLSGALNYLKKKIEKGVIARPSAPTPAAAFPGRKMRPAAKRDRQI